MIDTATVEDTLSFSTVEFTDIASRQGLIYRLRTDNGAVHGFGLFANDDFDGGDFGNSTYKPDRLLDGSTSTFATFGTYFQFDLGCYTSIAISGFSLQQRNYSPTLHQGLVLEARASDASDWVGLWSGAVDNVGPLQWNDITGLTDSTYYKSFKLSLLGTNVDGSSIFNATQLEVYGTFRMPSDFTYAGT